MFCLCHVPVVLAKAATRHTPSLLYLADDLESYTQIYIDNITKACDIALTNGLDLKQIHKNQDANFFTNQCMIIVVAHYFVEEIQRWSDDYQRVRSIVNRGCGILMLRMYVLAVTLCTVQPSFMQRNF